MTKMVLLDEKVNLSILPRKGKNTNNYTSPVKLTCVTNAHMCNEQSLAQLLAHAHLNSVKSLCFQP